MTGVAIPPDAPLAAAELAERLRDRAVPVGTTGPGGSVLKIRPPLIWEREDVQRFLQLPRSRSESSPSALA